MSIKQFSEAELKEMAMLEVAYELLRESNSPVDYYTLLKQVADAKGLSEEKTKERIAHLYTEMSIDGRFVNVGDNRWGLRAWYPFDQTEEELSLETKARKKKRKDEEDDDFFDAEDDFDEFEDLEDELDELANEEDEDFESSDDEKIPDDEELDDSFDSDLEDEESPKEDDDELV
ncbi:DNA-directed RNA polymerase subunit delta [Evansella sp. LMS18]|uniref:DNA-directed RNA polymerase subunit delta n=1 Tax=Evansella sp. LMS18 TaxID=2924033 RepID=UPI0020D02B93|nr:DNA-directed RNA polymerase subunit delta [Evansella sp. LMS18]UTR12235.1 DNA-directed RNA polymerase subunit delta [Evansella sp. LMS18]